MTAQILVTLPDKVYQRVQWLAQARQQDVAEAIVKILDETLPVDVADEDFGDLSELDQAVEREIAAYHAMHATLWEEYPGQHVAIYGGQLIDHDRDGVALSQRIDQQYPDEFVLMRKVESEPERVLYFRSPRMVKDE
ncbi:MAG: DUF5678 domain-containing protein [Chloroflexi bacterium]|nr:DUF5678 domain-containing protein [Chloroflexota bacterium]